MAAVGRKTHHRAGVPHQLVIAMGLFAVFRS